MFSKRLFIIGPCIVVLFIFTSTAMAVLDAPICVSPKKAYDSTAWWYSASRAPTFSWTPVSGATWYYIWVSETPTPSTAVFTQWVENGTSWKLNELKKLKAGTSYTWWVRAWNAAESYGDWSDGAAFIAGDFLTMSINATAFVPWNTSYSYSYCHAGGCLRPSDNFSHTYSAPIILPHGATLLAMKFYYRNGGAGVGSASTCELKFSAYNSIDGSSLASLTAERTAGYGSKTYNFSNTTINNIDNSYFIKVYLPSTSNDLIHVVLHYFN